MSNRRNTHTISAVIQMKKKKLHRSTSQKLIAVPLVVGRGGSRPLRRGRVDPTP
jgi:hypothetical protein